MQLERGKTYVTKGRGAPGELGRRVTIAEMHPNFAMGMFQEPDGTYPGSYDFWNHDGTHDTEPNLRIVATVAAYEAVKAPPRQNVGALIIAGSVIVGGGVATVLFWLINHAVH
jgi:hypothetical protein